MVIGSVLDGLVRNVAFLPPDPPTYTFEVDSTRTARLVLEPWALDMMYAYDLRRELIECQVVTCTHASRYNALRLDGTEALSFARPFVIEGKQGDLVAAWISYQDPDERDKAGLARRQAGMARSTQKPALKAGEARSQPARAGSASAEAKAASGGGAAEPFGNDGEKSVAKASPGVGGGRASRSSASPPPAAWVGTFQEVAEEATGAAGGVPRASSASAAPTTQKSPSPPIGGSSSAIKSPSPQPDETRATNRSASGDAASAASALPPLGDWLGTPSSRPSPGLRRPQTVPHCPASGRMLREVLASGDAGNAGRATQSAPGAGLGRASRASPPSGSLGGRLASAASSTQGGGAVRTRSSSGSATTNLIPSASVAPANAPASSSSQTPFAVSAGSGSVRRTASAVPAPPASALARSPSPGPASPSPLASAITAPRTGVGVASSASRASSMTASSSASALFKPVGRVASVPAARCVSGVVARAASSPSAAARGSPPLSSASSVCCPTLSATLGAPAWRRWSLPPPSSWPPRVVFYSHGNAIDLGMAAMHARGLAQALRCDVVCWDYAGYGASRGKPSASGLASDATRVLAFLVDELRIPSHRIVVYGQSIGSAAACGSAAAWAARPCVCAGGASGGGGGALGGLSHSIANALGRHSAAFSDGHKLQQEQQQQPGHPPDNANHRIYHHLHHHHHHHHHHRATSESQRTQPSPPLSPAPLSPSPLQANALAGVILHSPLASGMRVLSPGVAWWPGSLDVLTNDDRVRRIRAPVLVVHGLADRVVDVSNGMRLHKLARSAVAPLFLDGRGHDDLENDPRFWKRVIGFVNQQLA